MNQARGIRPSNGPFYSSAPQPELSYWGTQRDAIFLSGTVEKRKFKNLLIQSYWVIWLLFSFIAAYVLGFLILENPTDVGF